MTVLGAASQDAVGARAWLSPTRSVTAKVDAGLVFVALVHHEKTYLRTCRWFLVPAGVEHTGDSARKPQLVAAGPLRAVVSFSLSSVNGAVAVQFSDDGLTMTAGLPVFFTAGRAPSASTNGSLWNWPQGPLEGLGSWIQTAANRVICVAGDQGAGVNSPVGPKMHCKVYAFSISGVVLTLTSTIRHAIYIQGQPDVDNIPQVVRWPQFDVGDDYGFFVVGSTNDFSYTRQVAYYATEVNGSLSLSQPLHISQGLDYAATLDPIIVFTPMRIRSATSAKMFRVCLKHAAFSGFAFFPYYMIFFDIAVNGSSISKTANVENLQSLPLRSLFSHAVQLTERMVLHITEAWTTITGGWTRKTQQIYNTVAIGTTTYTQVTNSYHAYPDKNIDHMRDAGYPEGAVIEPGYVAVSWGAQFNKFGTSGGQFLHPAYPASPVTTIHRHAVYTVPAAERSALRQKQRDDNLKQSIRRGGPNAARSTQRSLRKGFQGTYH